MNEIILTLLCYTVNYFSYGDCNIYNQYGTLVKIKNINHF